MIKARYEASKLEEERAFEEQMKTLRRLEREANARAAAAAEAAEAAAFLAASPGPGQRESFPSLDDTAGSLGDLDLGPGARTDRDRPLAFAVAVDAAAGGARVAERQSRGASAVGQLLVTSFFVIAV
jgi:hypothetical protein